MRFNQKVDYKNMTDDEIVELFIENYKNTNPVDAVDFQRKTNNTPSQYILKKRLGMTYAEMCVYCGFRDSVRTRRVDREQNLKEKIDLFIKVCNELGYIPCKRDFAKSLGVKSFNFNGLKYEEFVKECGFDIKDIKYKNRKFKYVDDEYFINRYKNISEEKGSMATARDLKNELYEISKRFGSFNEFKRRCDESLTVLDNRRYSKEKIIKLLKSVYEEFGSMSYKDVAILFEDEEDFPKGLATLLYYFNVKSFNKIWGILHD